MRIIKNRNNDLETSDKNTRRRVKARRRLIFKAGTNFSIYQEAFILVMMVRKYSQQLQLDR